MKMFYVRLHQHPRLNPNPIVGYVVPAKDSDAAIAKAMKMAGIKDRCGSDTQWIGCSA